MSPVYLYGMISPSTVYVLDNQFGFPQPNGYAEIGSSLPSVGGEAANSAIILSKFGLKCKLDGCWLNTRDARKIFELLKPFDIDTSRLTIKENAGTEEIVIVDKTTRTIFGNYAQFHNGEKQWNSPNEDDIKDAPMIGLDPYFRNDALLAAQLCVKHQKPYVTLDCRYNDFMAQNAASVVISCELRDQAYAGQNMEEVFHQYLKQCKGLVIFTFGSNDIWYARAGQTIRTFKPYKIEPVDTTAAGDSFRGAIIYGLLQNWDDERVVEFASAVAACVCLTVPHTLNAPDLGGVLGFLSKNKACKT
jgi:sugar/nucleoside kinase (ribokinase family)